MKILCITIVLLILQGVERGAGNRVRCPLATYKTNHVKGVQTRFRIRVHPRFLRAMGLVDYAARRCKVFVRVTNAFRKTGQRLENAVVNPASRSNHLVGHAIDMNLETPRGWCNSNCLLARANDNANCFINVVKESGLRWGGDFNRKDPVHIDDGLNIRSSSLWKDRLKELQSLC